MTNAPDDSLTAVTHCSIEVLLSKELVVHRSMTLLQQITDKFRNAPTTSMKRTKANK